MKRKLSDVPYIAVTIFDGHMTATARLPRARIADMHMLSVLYGKAVTTLVDGYEKHPMEITVDGKTFIQEITEVEVNK